MAWAKPEHTRTEINAAAKKWLSDAATDQERSEALSIINNWRGSHAFPLNTFQVGLRRRGAKVTPDLIVAQRIKRLSSIELKLKLRPTMKLTQMQDLGGCRAILPTVNDVRALLKAYQESRMKHTLLTLDDYIVSPKASGYRGIHLVYAYNSDRSETYNGLKVEMQLRSQLQHAWATSVEVVGMLVDQALKSSLGDAGWLRFFQLMSSELARREGEPLVPGTPEELADARAEILNLAQQYDPVQRLKNYSATLQHIENAQNEGHFFILHLMPRKNALVISPFKKNESKKANDQYLLIEERVNEEEGEEAVLVSVDSVALLKRAYPNYFLDTGRFAQEVDRVVRLAKRT